MKDIFYAAFVQLIKSGKVTLHNARDGFACNSSSTHSIVVFPQGYETGSEHHDQERYDTTEDKLSYLFGMLATAGEYSNVHMLSEELEVEPNLIFTYTDNRTYLPLKHNSERVNLEFVREFAQWMNDPRIGVIVAGDGSSVTDSEDVEKSVDILPHSNKWIARKDHDPVTGESWWVLFDTNSGMKLRVSLTSLDPEKEIDPKRSNKPELVDVKITDACPFETDCGFCYMGSTKNGVEGNWDEVEKIVRSLGASEVFEIAYGGGEPTLWDRFEDLIRLTNQLGIIPNFTSKNFTWLRKKENAHLLVDCVGSVAFSVNDRASFEKFKKNYKIVHANMVEYTESKFAHEKSWHRYHNYADKVVIQCIPDLIEANLLRDMFRWASENGVRITLLGYKTTGRGSVFTPKFADGPERWTKILHEVSTAKNRGYLQVGIDTAMADQAEPLLKSLGVPDWSYHVVEGAFSCYIDAVKGEISASSYEEAKGIKLDLTQDASQVHQDIITNFMAINKELG